MTSALTNTLPVGYSNTKGTLPLTFSFYSPPSPNTESNFQVPNMFFVSPESTGIGGLPVLLSPGNTNTLQAGGKSYQQFLSGLGESVEIGRHKSWSGLNPLSKWCDGELPLQKTLKKKRKIFSSHHLQFNSIETVLAQRPTSQCPTSHFYPPLLFRRDEPCVPLLLRPQS